MRPWGSTFGEIILENQTIIQQLREGSGVRFKVLGDGKPWVIGIPTKQEGFYEAEIATKKKKVVEIDIPYEILYPIGAGVSFKKDDITGLHLKGYLWEKRMSSTIKVFDFEIYPGTASVATAPSVQPVPETALVPAVAQVPAANPASVPSAPQPVTQTPSPPPPQASAPTSSPTSLQEPLQTYIQASLQNILNGLPAIPIAGNNLKFQFSGADWTALLNGDNFWAGTIELEDTDGGSILSLKQTHMWPGAAGKAVGKLAGRFVGGAAGSALNTAGDIAGRAGAVEVPSGPVIVLEYKAGPPAKLSFLRSDRVATAGSPDSRYIVLADAQWKQEVVTEKESEINDTTVAFYIANEQINKQVPEVLTLEVNLASGSGTRIGQFILENETMVQQLQKGSGVRFKVLGDGKTWKLQIPTREAEADSCFYEAPIATRNGRVVEIDIPYSKLKQPSGWGKKVSFVKNSIMCLTIQRHSDIGGTGLSTIKVFDFEIY
jgi:hypothetical protein